MLFHTSTPPDSRFHLWLSQSHYQYKMHGLPCMFSFNFENKCMSDIVKSGKYWMQQNSVPYCSTDSKKRSNIAVSCNQGIQHYKFTSWLSSMFLQLPQFLIYYYLFFKRVTSGWAGYPGKECGTVTIWCIGLTSIIGLSAIKTANHLILTSDIISVKFISSCERRSLCAKLLHPFTGLFSRTT